MGEWLCCTRIIDIPASAGVRPEDVAVSGAFSIGHFTIGSQFPNVTVDQHEWCIVLTWHEFAPALECVGYPASV